MKWIVLLLIAYAFAVQPGRDAVDLLCPCGSYKDWVSGYAETQQTVDGP